MQPTLTDRPTLVKRVEVLAWTGGRDGFVRQHLDLTDEKNSQEWLLEDLHDHSSGRDPAYRF